VLLATSSTGPASETLHTNGRLAQPKQVENGSLATLCEKLLKFGARVVRHGRYVVQLAEVSVPRSLFASILRRIDHLRPKPPPLPGMRIESG
jgi:hypothetical protein